MFLHLEFEKKAIFELICKKKWKKQLLKVIISKDILKMIKLSQKYDLLG